MEFLVEGIGSLLGEGADVVSEGTTIVGDSMAGSASMANDMMGSSFDAFGDALASFPPPPVLPMGSGMGVFELSVLALLMAPPACLYGGWFSDDEAERAGSTRPCDPSVFEYPTVEFHEENLARGKCALLIGINYCGTSHALRGCGNDVALIYSFLLAGGWLPEDIIVLCDDEETCARINRQRLQPTAGAILRAYDYVRQFAAAVHERGGRSAVFTQFSGHGTSVRDTNGDEEDGMDEAIVPLDVNIHGVITDDSLYNDFLSRLPPSCDVAALFDCCHSGTILDLKYSWDDKKGTLVTQHRIADIGAYVQLISGCRDHQTSSDARDDARGLAAGAMTCAFLDTFYKSTNIPLLGLVDQMRACLKSRGFKQVPEASCSRPFDVSTPTTVSFMCGGAGPNIIYVQGKSKVDFTLDMIKAKSETVVEKAKGTAKAATSMVKTTAAGTKTATTKATNDAKRAAVDAGKTTKTAALAVLGALKFSKKEQDAATKIQRSYRRHSLSADKGSAAQ